MIGNDGGGGKEMVRSSGGRSFHRRGSIFVLLVTNDDKPHHFTQYKENNANRQLLKSRPSLADLRVHAVPARSN